MHSLLLLLYADGGKYSHLMVNSRSTPSPNQSQFTGTPEMHPAKFADDVVYFIVMFLLLAVGTDDASS